MIGKTISPRLIAVDLSKGEGHNHPDFKLSCQYLARIDGQYFVGHFTKQWYGWNFSDGWGGCGHQYDKPGSNSSDWEGLWRIVKAIAKVRS